MSTSSPTLRERLKHTFGCDLRSLAALRIALGLLLLADLAWRLPLFESLFTEHGAWPLAAVHEDSPRTWSLYFISGSSEWVGALFVIAALAAVALALGWWTRTATILSWVLLVSLHQRNGLVLNAGDQIFRLLLFWGAWLPLGARWSLDSRREGALRAVHVSAASIALLVQLALIYFFNALYKTGAAWREGSAILQTLSLETYVTPLGSAMIEHPALLRAGTHAVWWLELLGPALIFLPWKNAAARIAACALFMGFHAALFATLRIGLFPLIGIVAWLPVLPSAFWDRLTRACAEDAPQGKPLHLCAQIAVVIAFAYVVTWNVIGYATRETRPTPAWVTAFQRAGHALALNQKWSLFAPFPTRSEGWMIAVIETEDGGEFDALTGAEIRWARPRHLGERLPTAQWRKFLASLRETGRPARVRWFAAWLRREWERAHPEARVVRVRIHYLWERTAKRGGTPENWFIYEEPPGTLTEEATRRGFKVVPPVENNDN